MAPKDISMFKGLIEEVKSDVSVENFPYYLGENIKNALISSAFVPLKLKNYQKIPKKLQSIDPRFTILGPKGSDFYLENLVKALANHFNAKLFNYDTSLFSMAKNNPDLITEAVDKVFNMFEKESKNGPVIVLMKDLDSTLVAYKDTRILKRMFAKLNILPEGVVVISIHPLDEVKVDESIPLSARIGAEKENLTKTFLNYVIIKSPEDEDAAKQLAKDFQRDAGLILGGKNLERIEAVMEELNLECKDLSKDLFINDNLSNRESCMNALGWALVHHLENNECEALTEEEKRENKKISISCESLKHGMEILRLCEDNTPESTQKKSIEELVGDDELEKMLICDVILAGDIKVKFDDIGSLDSAKKTLKELVMLPLQRPKLFSKGQLTKPCKGILLFGPPGTGKTMLAKAVATEAGANFINVNVSNMTSKYYGEGEKITKSVFTLASKLSPCVIFIDEVDALLSQRGSSEEHECMRKIKTEFMQHWDGLATKSSERVVVLAATNRPFDLDEAVIRRMPRRLMIDLPDPDNRYNILSVMMSKEVVSRNLDLYDVACMTEGFSGSDLKNLCSAAAYYPIRELLDKEQKEKEKALADNRPPPPLKASADIRPIRMSDFRSALEQVSASVSCQSDSIQALVQWNIKYGGGEAKVQESEEPQFYYM